MNSLSKIAINISFPLGAFFHQHIVDLTYKQFLRMLQQITCININGKCKECPLQKDCQYYHITGENFSEYPGVIFVRDDFAENIFHNGDEYKFEIYFVGDSDKYIDYVEIFFKDHLQFKLAGFDFLIKSINHIVIDNFYKKVAEANVVTVIETTDFIASYNNMVNYYNKQYNCSYAMIRNILSINNIKTINAGRVKFRTKSINKNGYVYHICLDEELSVNLLTLGIGKYNYMGGGKIEITCKDES